MLGIPHSICNDDYGLCAFTTKVKMFPSIVQPFGWDVIEYSNGRSMSNAKEHVVMLSKTELEDILGKPSELSSFKTEVDSEIWKIFYSKLLSELIIRVKDGDIIAHPYGPIFKKLVQFFPNCYHVETGVGYLNEEFGAHRIFESYSWMHYNHGYNHRWGKAYEWVIPNGFEVDAWDDRFEPSQKNNEGYLLFAGRIVEEKGMHVVKAIAEHLKEKIVVAGIGFPALFESPYLDYIGNVIGQKQLNNLYKDARAVLMPTQYNEPLGFVAIEAMLCGTPVISTDFGSFPEIIEQGKTGFRCHTFGDFLAAIEEAPKLDRGYIRHKTKTEFSLRRAGTQYDKVFKQLLTLNNDGWYSTVSHHIGGEKWESETE